MAAFERVGRVTVNTTIFFPSLNKIYKVFYTQEFEVKLKKPRGRDLGFTLTHGPSGEGFYIHEIYASPALTPPRKLQSGDRILMVSHTLVSCK